MNPLLVKTPNIVKRIYPNRIWSLPNYENTVYLTFDDGPISEITPWVLDLLKEYNAKATFFCIGENVRKYPEIFKRIDSEGHTIGNHTFNHLNGWKTSTSKYLNNIEKADSIITHFSNPTIKQSNNLFRPPYGKITSKQSEILQKKDYKIIMWDVLSGDFSKKLSKEKCLQNVLKNIISGSIIVFHDSIKAEMNLRYVLPKALEFISEKGWECSALA